MKLENQQVLSKQLELLQRQLQQHQYQEQQATQLLKLGFILTFLLYLVFNMHLYLGDALSWSAYFQSFTATMGFSFTVLLVVLLALFLSWVKHHAYLHFGFYGSVSLIVCTVIGFALFAEFFSSSANQDAKAQVLLEKNNAYQTTLKRSTYNKEWMNTQLIESIAQAEQQLARCEAKLKVGKEKHCKGDQAKLQALRQSEQTSQQAQAHLALERDKLHYIRQDQLKAEAYNPVIVLLARIFASIIGGSYQEHIKAAVVVVMLFVAVCFEILHHFLSHAKKAALRAVEALEISIAKYTENLQAVQPHSEPPDLSKPVFGFPITANTQQLHNHAELSKLTLFKYQRHLPPVESSTSPQKLGFIGFIDPTRSQASVTPLQQTPTLETHSQTSAHPQLSSLSLGTFKARGGGWASPPFTEPEISQEPRARANFEHPELGPVQPRARGEEDLFKQWLTAVRLGECKPSSDPTWLWIQKQIAPKEIGSKTHDRTRIRRMQQAFFARAMKEGLMIENPNYKNGGKKYLWIA